MTEQSSAPEGGRTGFFGARCDHTISDRFPLWYAPSLSSCDIGQIAPDATPSITKDTVVFKRFRRSYFEQSIRENALWFATPRFWREGDPLEAAILPIGVQPDRANGRCDTLCCCWSIMRHLTGIDAQDPVMLGTWPLFTQFAGETGCILVLRLGELMTAMCSPEVSPEARVVLWPEEVAGLLEATPAAPLCPQYFGWPLSYKQRRFAPEREIRFVLRHKDHPDTCLQGPPRNIPFTWEKLSGCLLVPEGVRDGYAAILRKCPNPQLNVKNIFQPVDSAIECDANSIADLLPGSSTP